MTSVDFSGACSRTEMWVLVSCPAAKVSENPQMPSTERRGLSQKVGVAEQPRQSVEADRHRSEYLRIDLGQETSEMINLLVKPPH
jgi:hypothetical protein